MQDPRKHAGLYIQRHLNHARGVDGVVVWESPVTLKMLFDGAQAGWGDLGLETEWPCFDGRVLDLCRAYRHGLDEARAFYEQHHASMTSAAQEAFKALLAGRPVPDTLEGVTLIRRFVPTVPKECLLHGAERGPPTRSVLDPLWARTHQECPVPDYWTGDARVACRGRMDFLASVDACPRVAYSGNPHAAPVRLHSIRLWLPGGAQLQVHTATLLPTERRGGVRKFEFRLLNAGESETLAAEYWPSAVRPNRSYCEKTACS